MGVVEGTERKEGSTRRRQRGKKTGERGNEGLGAPS